MKISIFLLPTLNRAEQEHYLKECGEINKLDGEKD